MPAVTQHPPEKPILNQRNLVERKDIILTGAKFDTQGTFQGYASTFETVDLQQDVVKRGAFKKTISENGGVFPLLSQHDYTREIGLVRAREDEHGLFVEGEFYKDDQGELLALARDEYVKMKRRQEAGRPLQMSIGYRAINPKFQGSTRILDQIALAEVSLVTFPANPEAVTTSVKGDTGRLRKTIEGVTERLKARAEEKDFQGTFEARARRFTAMSTIDAALWTMADILEEALWAMDDEVDDLLAQLPNDLKDFATAVTGAVSAFHDRVTSKADWDEPEHHELEPREHSRHVAVKADAPANSEPGDHSLTETLKQLTTLKLRLAADQLQRDATKGTTHA